VNASGSDRRPLAVFLMGPTASGKTALAVHWAERFGLDLISVDSALIYRGMDIGTAKPDAQTLARFPHRLVDIRDPEQTYSAAEFRADALREMAAIRDAGKVPLLVGGTGLYFRALQSGLSALPEADSRVRAALAAEAAQLGWPALHARLAQLDPAAAARIRPSDPQRIQRALEVIAITGRPLSEQQGGPRERFPYRVLKLALLPGDRQILHQRVADRFDAMLAQGFLAEVKNLHRQNLLESGVPALRAVGYRQAWEHLNGDYDRDEMRNRAVFATRQLAKRQITWLRGEFDALPIDCDASGAGMLADQALGAFLMQA
jgi:tRNA dimethylallyltransferase